MKLAVFVLVLGLCLAVNAAVVDYPSEDEVVIEFSPSELTDAITDDYLFGGVFGLLKPTIKAGLRTLKGVHCTIERVISIRAASFGFIQAFKDCNSAAFKDLNNVINQVQTVVKTCNDIINLNENVCNNADYNAEADANKKSSKSCFSKLVSKMVTLKKQVGNTITLSMKLSSTPGAYGACNVDAVSDLLSVFTEFRTFVKQCSKLTS
uniref:Protein TsetseEP domain-containing protein n=1 Tax=Bactrocera latifrons TaxID=174628 RepID=A0A0K8ULG7_BACLA